MRNTIKKKKKKDCTIQFITIKDKERLWKYSRLKEIKQTQQVNSRPDPRLNPNGKRRKKYKALLDQLTEHEVWMMY